MENEGLPLEIRFLLLQNQTFEIAKDLALLFVPYKPEGHFDQYFKTFKRFVNWIVEAYTKTTVVTKELTYKQRKELKQITRKIKVWILLFCLPIEIRSRLTGKIDSQIHLKKLTPSFLAKEATRRIHGSGLKTD